MKKYGNIDIKLRPATSIKQGAAVVIIVTVLLFACIHSYAGITMSMKSSSSISMRLEAFEKYYFTERKPTFKAVTWFIDWLLKAVRKENRKDLEELVEGLKKIQFPMEMKEAIEEIREKGCLVEIRSTPYEVRRTGNK